MPMRISILRFVLSFWIVLAAVPLTVSGGALAPMVRASQSANGKFLVVTECEYDSPNRQVPRKLVRSTYRVLQVEPFINADYRLDGATTFWSDSDSYLSCGPLSRNCNFYSCLLRAPSALRRHRVTSFVDDPCGTGCITAHSSVTLKATGTMGCCYKGNCRLAHHSPATIRLRCPNEICVLVTGILLCMGPLLGAKQTPSDRTGFHVEFATSNGKVTLLDTRTGTLDSPRSRGAGLRDCGDKVQVCLTDHNGFAFAYFRKCDDAGRGDWQRLMFPPKVVSVLHNSDVWMVFDASPNYLFHYGYSKGILGIYVGPTASFDFRSVLHDRNFQVGSLDSVEYRNTGPETVAACSD
jgi:hypothetical protein